MRKDSTTKYLSHRDSHSLLVRPLFAVHQLCLLRNASWPHLLFLPTATFYDSQELQGWVPRMGLEAYTSYFRDKSTSVPWIAKSTLTREDRGVWVIEEGCGCADWVYSLGRCRSCGPGRSPGQCRPGAAQAPVSSAQVWRRQAEDTGDRIQDFTLQGEKHAQDCSHGMLSLHLCSGRLTTSFLRRCTPLYTHSSICIVNASMISYFFFPNNLFWNFSNQRSCRYNAENTRTLASRFFN